MKLAEAILERCNLESRLVVLESRLTLDSAVGVDVYPLIENIQLLINQARDLRIAIAWTESVNRLHNLTIKGQRLKIESQVLLSRILEKVDRERADILSEDAFNNQKIIEAATWIVDLEIPDLEDMALNKKK